MSKGSIYSASSQPESAAAFEGALLDADGWEGGAWRLGNCPEAPVLEPLIRALQPDVAAVRLWCPGSLAEAGSRSPAKADPAASQLFVSLRICGMT